jgi:hypothetical protein
MNGFIEKEHAGLIVRIERPVMRFGLRLWIFQRHGDGIELLKPNNTVGEERTGFTWMRVDPAVDFSDSPTFDLDDKVVAALAFVLNDFLPPDARVEEHLRDTIKTRDRLLTLVEKVVNKS